MTALAHLDLSDGRAAEAKSHAREALGVVRGGVDDRDREVEALTLLAHVAPDPASGQALWGFATAAAGLMIALNFGVRFFAVLMIIFVMVTTFYFHDFWNQAAPDNAKTIIDALKNLSIIGALFMIAGYGRGRRVAEPAYGDV